MTTVNDIADILRIIREQPEWAEALRSALLSKDVLELPQRLAELTATVAEFSASTDRRLAALESGQARLEGDVDELKAGQARLEEGQARLEGDVDELKAGQARLEEGQARLESTVGRLNGSFSTLQGQVSNMRGTEYEIKVGKSIATTIGRQLNLMRVRILKSHLIPENAVLHDLMDDAQEQGVITREEQEDFDNIDLVLRGRSIDRATVYVAVEVSITAGDSDINRGGGQVGNPAAGQRRDNVSRSSQRQLGQRAPTVSRRTGCSRCRQTRRVTGCSDTPNTGASHDHLHRL